MNASGKTKIGWSRNFAYAVGLITTDGSLSSDGRHISFCSKDIEQVRNLLKCLRIKSKISHTKSGLGKVCFRAQIGDVLLYRFLLTIGLMPNKSKILKEIKIPSKYIFDFLRGHFDGDGTFYSYFDKRWKSSFLFYMGFASASRAHIDWIQKTVYDVLKICGHITEVKGMCQLRYGKKESLKLLSKIYDSSHSIIYLRRKKEKIQFALEKISASGEMVYTQP